MKQKLSVGRDMADTDVDLAIRVTAGVRRQRHVEGSN